MDLRNLGAVALGLAGIWCAFLAGECHARGVFNSASVLDALALVCLGAALWARS